MQCTALCCDSEIRSCGARLGVHAKQFCYLAVMLISSVVIHCYHLFPGIICRHQLSTRVLHLAIRNKCIWTPDFLQLSLASIITLVGKKIDPIRFLPCKSFKGFCLAGISTFRHCSTPISFHAIREILYTCKLLLLAFHPRLTIFKLNSLGRN